MAMAMLTHAGHAVPPLFSFPHLCGPGVPGHHLTSLRRPSTATITADDDSTHTTRAQNGPAMPLASRVPRHRHALDTRRPTHSRSPWTPCEHLELPRDTATPLDTPSTTTRTRRRRRSKPWSAAAATDVEAT
jgi:hypothetical protein